MTIPSVETLRFLLYLPAYMPGYILDASFCQPACYYCACCLLFSAMHALLPLLPPSRHGQPVWLSRPPTWFVPHIQCGPTPPHPIVPCSAFHYDSPSIYYSLPTIHSSNLDFYPTSQLLQLTPILVAQSWLTLSLSSMYTIIPSSLTGQLPTTWADILCHLEDLTVSPETSWPATASATRDVPPRQYSIT